MPLQRKGVVGVGEGRMAYPSGCIDPTPPSCRAAFAVGKEKVNSALAVPFVRAKHQASARPPVCVVLSVCTVKGSQRGFVFRDYALRLAGLGLHGWQHGMLLHRPRMGTAVWAAPCLGW
jgi:hypothetical protein